MTIKIALLKSQQQVIADFKEIMSGDEPVAYLFKDPHLVDFNQFSLSKEEDSCPMGFSEVIMPNCLTSGCSGPMIAMILLWPPSF